MNNKNILTIVLIISFVMMAFGGYLFKFASGIDSTISGLVLAIAGFILLIMWIFGRK